MSGDRSNGAETPIADRLERLQQAHHRALAYAERIRTDGAEEPWWSSDIPPDHPLAKALGHEQALALAAKVRAVDRPACPSGLSAAARSIRASQRRIAIIEMSRAGASVREIACALDLSYNYVVQLRAELDVPRGRQKRAAGS